MDHNPPTEEATLANVPTTVSVRPPRVQVKSPKERVRVVYLILYDVLSGFPLSLITCT